MLLTEEEDFDYEDEEEEDEELDEDGLNHMCVTFFFSFYFCSGLGLFYLCCLDCDFLIYFPLLLPAFSLKVKLWA